jgi:hypothetical protein
MEASLSVLSIGSWTHELVLAGRGRCNCEMGSQGAHQVHNEGRGTEVGSTTCRRVTADRDLAGPENRERFEERFDLGDISGRAHRDDS